MEEYPVRRYDTEFSDVAAFLSYLTRPAGRFPTLYTEPYFRWKIAANPFGRSACFLREDGGVSASHCSYTGKPINPALKCAAAAAELGDTHTRPDFQGRGHFAALGRWAIEDCLASDPAQDVLMYGLPNDNALPGWTRRCGCEVFGDLGVSQVIRRPLARALKTLGKRAKGWRGSRSALRICGDPRETGEEIDALWARAEGTEGFLLKKDGAWWRWRYAVSTERYLTYGLRSLDRDRLAGYVVAKLEGRIPRTVHICDVFGEDVGVAVEAFRLFMDQIVRVTDVVTMWLQADTRLAAEGPAYGFEKQRGVPVMFAVNDAYRRLREHHPRVYLSLGDTDNA